MLEYRKMAVFQTLNTETLFKQLKIWKKFECATAIVLSSSFAVYLKLTFYKPEKILIGNEKTRPLNFDKQ